MQSIVNVINASGIGRLFVCIYHEQLIFLPCARVALEARDHNSLCASKVSAAFALSFACVQGPSQHFHHVFGWRFRFRRQTALPRVGTALWRCCLRRCAI